MCMKYVNSTVECYRVVALNAQGQVSVFYDPFDTIIASTEADGSYSIGGFSIKTGVCILGTDNDNHAAENPISQRAKLKFTIRMTKCAKEPENRLGIDLDEFTVDIGQLIDDNKVSFACYPFINYTRVTRIGKIHLPTNAFGKYVIKVLVKGENDQKQDTIQAMIALTISKPSES